MLPRQHAIMVVDDEPDIVKSLQDLLHLQYRVLGATGPAAAITLLQEHEVHVVISDQRMPGMTGVEFLHEVCERYPQTVRLLFTGHADIKAVIDAINRGSIYRYITKPWDPDELRAIIRESVERYDLRARQTQLLAALQRNSEFLASMSHELRTPLNAIIGFTGTLLMGLPGPLTADQEQQLRIIQASGRHLLSLINDLLDLAKIEAGKVEVRQEPVSCQDVMEEIASALRPLAEGKGLRFDLRMPSDRITVLTDRRALSQILINLTNNAIKFTEKGEVCLELAGGHNGGGGVTEIHVSDTGRGIKPEDQTRLFQAFVQLDGTSAGRHEGTGLGLHLSQKLASLIGAQIVFRSEVAAGSTFTLRIKGEQTCRPASW